LPSVYYRLGRLGIQRSGANAKATTYKTCRLERAYFRSGEARGGPCLFLKIESEESNRIESGVWNYKNDYTTEMSIL